MAAALAALATVAGCWRTTYHFDAMPGAPSAAYDGRWRLGLVAGIIETSAAVDLDHACGGAPVATIEEETTFLNALASGALNIIVAELPVFHFRSVTATCAAPTRAPMPGAVRPQ
jgi:hypothetical protein